MMLNLLKSHMFAILLALVVGVIYIGPNIYHAHTAGYQGILMADAPDEVFYLSVINKSYTSPTLVRDPFQYEYQHEPNPLQYFWAEFVLGKIGAGLHLPIGVLTEVMEFIFPLLLTLAVYAFAYRMSGSRLAGFLSAGAVLLGNEFVQPSSVSNAINTFLMHGGYREFLTYSRPISPQLNSLFLFAMLGCLLYLLRNARSKQAIVLAGVGLGLMVYAYLYFWAFTVTLLGVIFLYAVAGRRWHLAFAACAAGFISLGVMVPFLLENIPLVLRAGGSQLTQSVHTHRIIVEKMILAPLFLYALVYLYAWWSRGQGNIGQWAHNFAQKYLFVVLLLITGVIVSNQQVLTGVLLYQEHFHFFTNIPLFLLSMSLLGAEVLIFFPQLWRVALVGAAVIVLAWFAVGVQVSSFKGHSAESLRYQPLAPVFAYLRGQTPEAVVLAGPYLSTRLTIYTQEFTYDNGGYGTAFRVPSERIMNDYLIRLQLRGVTKDMVHSYVYQPANREEVGSMLFIGTYWRDLCGSYSCFPDSVLEDVIAKYKDFVSHPLLENLKTYKIDYVLTDNVQDTDWSISSIVKKPPLVTAGDFTLYRVR